MKITILPFEKAEKPLDSVTVHNLIKRCEEDLLTAYPDLREFIVKLQVYQSYSRYNSVKPGNYSLLEDESVVKLGLATYPSQDPQIVYDHITKQLLLMKQSAYS